MLRVLQDHHTPVRVTPPTNYDPSLKAVLYTLDISLRFLGAATLGRYSDAYGQALIESYWRRIFASGNARLEVVGQEHFGGRAMIVMSNHTSLLDIPALMGAIPGVMRMVMKQELTRVPIWGQALVKSGFIPVARGTKSRAVAQLNLAGEAIRKGVHIWIAPEGTRSRTGELLPFKKGGFHLARDLQVPIIPTWISGASSIIPPESFRVIHDGTVRVTFGSPVDPNSEPTVEALSARVREEMVALSRGPSTSKTEAC